jgi:hypothetical protein
MTARPRPLFPTPPPTTTFDPFAAQYRVGRGRRSASFQFIRRAAKLTRRMNRLDSGSLSPMKVSLSPLYRGADGEPATRRRCDENWIYLIVDENMSLVIQSRVLALTHEIVVVVVAAAAGCVVVDGAGGGEERMQRRLRCRDHPRRHIRWFCVGVRDACGGKRKRLPTSGCWRSVLCALSQSMTISFRLI